MDVMVESRRSAQVAEMLHERDIPYSVAIGNLESMIEREKGNACKKTKNAEVRTMDWKNYYRLDVIYAFLEDLAAQYPYLCTVSVIGKSAEGRDLRMIKISNGNDDNTAVWIDGTIHPREWVSTSVVTYIIDQLVRNFHEQPESVTNKDWYILPVLNPDGYEYTHTNDRMWRKNRARYGECVGVDLNRNFSYGWGEKGEEGSSEDPGSIFYRGPKPFSEPETAAVKRVILENEGKFKVFLSFHSYGEVVIFPWGYTPDPCPDYVELLEGGTAMAKAIYDTNGHTYKVGSTKDLMYYAAGNSTDWSYGVANIPYSYMVELRSKQHRFLLPKDEIAATANEVMNGVFRLMDFVDRRCRGTMDWKNYYRLDVIYAFLEDLAAQYPYLCTVSVIGKSAEGRDLRMIKISNGNDDNTAVWIDGTIHPREWVSTSVVTYIIDQLVRNFHEQPESVTNKDWYILPVLNPDGYEYTHTNDRMWRKNRARYGECVGVDLNRNFSYGWGEKGEEGSSEDPGSIFYRGPKPFSEPETAAVKRVILENEGKFKVFLSFHSYGEVVIFPWGYTPDPCPDYVELLEGGTAMAKAIYDTNGHTYKVGSTKDLMYYAAGNSTDWSYGVANIPYSYMVELRSKQHRFLLPKDEIAATANEVMNGVFRLMDFVDRRCRGTQSCFCPK